MKTSKTQVNCSFYGKIAADSFNALKSFDNLDIILYKIHLPAYANIVADLYKILDLKEIQRAKRYSKEKDKNRFIICRSLLKFVLSIHTKWDVSQIKLDYHTNKKPYLSSLPTVSFNVTHSEDFGLIALANPAIGVDIEPIIKNNELVNSL